MMSEKVRGVQYGDCAGVARAHRSRDDDAGAGEGIERVVPSPPPALKASDPSYPLPTRIWSKERGVFEDGAQKAFWS